MEIKLANNSQEKKIPNLVVGLIPCQNRHFLDIIWPVIKPGIQKLLQYSHGQWDEFRIWKEVFSGTMQLYVGYLENQIDNIPEDKFQEYFVGKMRTPHEDYVGFSVIRLLDTCAEVFLYYYEPRFRGTNIDELTQAYMEKQARMVGAPYLQISTVLESDTKRECRTKDYMEQAGFDYVCSVYRKKLK